jgi:DNA-binding transcriptional ArsR family regulator
MGREFKLSDKGPEETMNNILEVFQALSHPVRLEICQVLMTRQYSVGELCKMLGLKQYAISQQLAVLRKAEIVGTKRDARRIIYFLSNDKVRRILRVSIANLVQLDASSDLIKLDRKQQAGGFARIF